MSRQSLNLSVAGSEDTLKITRSTVGVIPSGLGIGLGYSVNSWFVFGARVSQSTQTTSYNDQKLKDDQTETFSVLPYVEINMTQTGTFQPFLSLSGGHQRSSNKTGDVETGSATNNVVGLGLGGHIFASEDCSIDPSVSVLQHWGSDRIANIDYQHSGWGVLGTISLSGWFGGSRNGKVSDTSIVDASKSMLAASGASSTKEERSPLTVRVELDKTTSVLISGTPHRDAPFLFRLKILGSDTRFANCNQLLVRIEGTSLAITPGQSYELTSVRRSEGGTIGAWDSLQGEASLDLVQAIGRAPGSVELIACDDHVVTFSPDARSKVHAFLEHFEPVGPTRPGQH